MRKPRNHTHKIHLDKLIEWNLKEYLGLINCHDNTKPYQEIRIKNVEGQKGQTEQD